MHSSIAAAAALFFLTSSPGAENEAEIEARALAERNEAQLEAYILRGEGGSIREIAHPEYMLVFAPGLLESLDMVSSTAGNVQVTRFDQKTLNVRIVGDTAVILSRADLEGTVAGRPFPTPLLMTHTYARADGKWLLLQRTMTPIVVPEEVFERLLGHALPNGKQ